jgi:hypothetical protein
MTTIHDGYTNKQTIQQKILEISESINIVWEWSNITTIIIQAADEILGKHKAFTYTHTHTHTHTQRKYGMMK